MKYISLFLVLLANTFFAQVNLKIGYQYHYLSDSTKTDSKKDDIMVLHHIDNKSLFYSELRRKGDSALKQDIENKIDIATMTSNRSKYNTSRSSIIITKNFIENKSDFSDKILQTTYLYSEDLPKIDWTITNKTDTILGYEVVEAKGNFRGRNYTAWYAPAIPLPDGPYKFNGLPGLILKIEDDKKNFSFIAISIEKNKPESPMMENGKIISTDRKKYNELKERSVKDFVQFVNSTSEVKITPKTPQKIAEKPYNPIELK